MTAEARRAIAVIRKCIEADRYALTVHFLTRMEQRGLFWPDVVAVIDRPRSVRPQRMDEYGRPKWIIRGNLADGLDIEVVCAIETDLSETEFITLYWED
ncbi:MAG TPA: DUF4258 domain-containing protein [Tepidisphaeraceae bacterium]|nr:DUF4258 domain-containing protein [Tepidisphaeraceae bacterium]